MRILVVDVAATESGALVVLEQFYRDLQKNVENTYFFCISTPNFEKTQNIKLLQFPWVKKSWLHRLWFDHITTRRLLKKYKIDRILSLQNTTISGGKLPQTVFLHQALPFIEHRFHFRENKLLWVYQNIISRIIFRSLKKANKIIVQTKWMKQGVINMCGVAEEKIHVQPPKSIVLSNYHYKPDALSTISFVYPATAIVYKNHQLILDACKLLFQDNIKDFNIHFTITGEENALAKNIQQTAHENGYPILFHAPMQQEELFALYQKCILLFPSYVESYGLPLAEARAIGSPILASDCAFSHELLEEYDKAAFFDPFDVNQLTSTMKKMILQ